MNATSSGSRAAATEGAASSSIFCTYFDRNYLLQGLALYLSLVTVRPDFELWMLCLDDESAHMIAALNLAHARRVTVTELIASYPPLANAKTDRSTVEFYYACTPWLIAYVARSRPRSDRVVYVDADMFYFADPAIVQAEAKESNVQIVPHDSGDEEIEARHGRYNVCYVGFAQTAEARRCLLWWGESALRSTSLGNGTWGDQKYLDDFAEFFHGVEVLGHPGAALAPWNVTRHRIRAVDRQLMVDDRPLVAYHFARFLPVFRHFFVPVRRGWIPRSALQLIYRPYMQTIRFALDSVTSINPDYRPGYTGRNMRGLLLATLAGRGFYEGSLGLRRLGLYVPTSRAEFQAISAGRRTTNRRK